MWSENEANDRGVFRVLARPLVDGFALGSTVWMW